MPREDIEFKTSDNVTLRGWFYTPENAAEGPIPCLVMAHGFSAVKEMDLNTFAEYFVANLSLSCLVYDNRGFGESDTKEGQPRQEIIPAQQTSDYSDAITYAQMRSDVNKDKIGIWGSSYSGGHVLHVGATDRRVKVVLCQAPMVNGWANFHRLIRPDYIGGLNAMFEGGKLNLSGLWVMLTVQTVIVARQAKHQELFLSLMLTLSSHQLYQHPTAMSFSVLGRRNAVGRMK